MHYSSVHSVVHENWDKMYTGTCPYSLSCSILLFPNLPFLPKFNYNLKGGKNDNKEKI